MPPSIVPANTATPTLPCGAYAVTTQSALCRRGPASHIPHTPRNCLDLVHSRSYSGDGRPKRGNPYSDPKWGHEMAEMARRLREDFRKPLSPGRPNLLTVDTVIRPDGTKVITVKSPRAAPGTAAANHNSTGAFILWKGFGKKKIRKAQRNRPSGWRGNHPEQKPRERFGRETLDDIPAWTPPLKARSMPREIVTTEDDWDYGREIAAEELAEEAFGFAD